MCPILENVDLTSVSTEREPFPEGSYKMTVVSSEFQDDSKKTLIIKSRIESPDEFQNREFWDFVNLVQNDGKQNRISMEHIKRYMEAAFGKGSAEAEAVPPDTDQLNGHQVEMYLVIDSYKPKGWVEGQPLRKNNKIKKILAA